MPIRTRFNHKHLLEIEDLSASDITTILNLADKFHGFNRKKDKKKNRLKGQTLINLFFEDSTRTRTSFELAGKRLSADVINMSVATSAVNKGETLLDTAATLNAMNPDFITVRHPHSGAVKLLSRKVKCSVINAGDGAHEHPTQALLDAMTIIQKKKKLKGQVVTICGDILHSRVARSNIKLLKTMGAVVKVVAPPTLMPVAPETLGIDEHFTNLEEGIKGSDVIMMLRLQQERMQGLFIPSVREYFHLYGLTKNKLTLANKNAVVMHPGPMNRGVEIDSELADDLTKTAVLEQVENGVAVRQAILLLLAKAKETTLDTKRKGY